MPGWRHDLLRHCHSFRTLGRGRPGHGGTSNNATVLTAGGDFLVDRLIEVPSRVTEGTAVAVDAMLSALETVLEATGTARSAVRAVGLDTPGPASADGVISARGATNFSDPEWWGFDVRGALEAKLGLPVVYNNDGNAAALYAHHEHFGADSTHRSSVSAIVGTGLGGGVVERGQVVRGAAGMAASWATSRSRWTACSVPTNRCRSAPAATPGTLRASRR